MSYPGVKVGDWVVIDPDDLWPPSLWTRVKRLLGLAHKPCKWRKRLDEDGFYTITRISSSVLELPPTSASAKPQNQP